MAVVANKRSIIVLYSSANDLHSHRVRFILAEKGVAVDMVDIDATNSQELFDMRVQGKTPMLVDRDLVLSDSNIIMEYLDERFPHPPLLPVYPVARAKSRVMITRIQREWYTAAQLIETGTEAQAKLARKQLEENLININPMFVNSLFFFGEEFSLIDCCFAPLFWRLGKLGIDFPTKAKEVKAYAERLFQRASFKASLTESEAEMAN